jgi:DNA-binding NarL/FixJ family response regulator
LGQATRQPPVIGSPAAPAISTPDEIIVLTMHEDPGTVRDSRVSGYLAKTAGPDELRGALNPDPPTVMAVIA